MTDHAPSRPSWTCGACGQDWPCTHARVDLGQQYLSDRVALSIYMGAQLQAAAAELPPNPFDLFHRFVAWTR